MGWRGAEEKYLSFFLIFHVAHFVKHKNRHFGRLNIKTELSFQVKQGERYVCTM